MNDLEKLAREKGDFCQRELYEHGWVKSVNRDQVADWLTEQFHSALEQAVKPYNDGWLDQAARDAKEIVRLEMIIDKLQQPRGESAEEHYEGANLVIQNSFTEEHLDFGKTDMNPTQIAAEAANSQ